MSKPPGDDKKSVGSQNDIENEELEGNDSFLNFESQSSAATVRITDDDDDKEWMSKVKVPPPPTSSTEDGYLGGEESHDDSHKNNRSLTSIESFASAKSLVKTAEVTDIVEKVDKSTWIRPHMLPRKDDSDSSNSNSDEHHIDEEGEYDHEHDHVTWHPDASSAPSPVPKSGGDVPTSIDNGNDLKTPVKRSRKRRDRGLSIIDRVSNFLTTGDPPSPDDSKQLLTSRVASKKSISALCQNPNTIYQVGQTSVAGTSIPESVIHQWISEDREDCPKCELFEYMIKYGGEHILQDKDIQRALRKHMEYHKNRAVQEMKRTYQLAERLNEVEEEELMAPECLSVLGFIKCTKDQELQTMSENYQHQGVNTDEGMLSTDNSSILPSTTSTSTSMRDKMVQVDGRITNKDVASQAPEASESTSRKGKHPFGSNLNFGAGATNINFGSSNSDDSADWCQCNCYKWLQDYMDKSQEGQKSTDKKGASTSKSNTKSDGNKSSSDESSSEKPIQLPCNLRYFDCNNFAGWSGGGGGGGGQRSVCNCKCNSNCSNWGRCGGCGSCWVVMVPSEDSKR